MLEERASASSQRLSSDAIRVQKLSEEDASRPWLANAQRYPRSRSHNLLNLVANQGGLVQLPPHRDPIRSRNPSHIPPPAPSTYHAPSCTPEDGPIPIAATVRPIMVYASRSSLPHPAAPSLAVGRSISPPGSGSYRNHLGVENPFVVIVALKFRDSGDQGIMEVAIRAPNLLRVQE
ncbi:hypothetical protein FRC11_007966 [Ceratobasidium sp. 423]|nr:hypothetical protein FRC11_007966 [Ceratobasidium sp. 423]